MSQKSWKRRDRRQLLALGALTVVTAPIFGLRAASSPSDRAIVSTAGDPEAVTFDSGRAVSHWAMDPLFRPEHFIRSYGRGGLDQGVAGAHIYHVTSLDDSGAGTLRDAVSANSLDTRGGPRIVVFDVSGRITVRSGGEIAIDRDKLWIAGQTSPSGIQLYREQDNPLRIAASHVRVEHLEICMGAPQSADAAKTQRGLYTRQLRAQNLYDIDVNHITLFGVADEGLSNYVRSFGPKGAQKLYYAENQRWRNCISGEAFWGRSQAVSDGVVHEADHAFGSLISKGAKWLLVQDYLHAGMIQRTPVISVGGWCLIAGGVTVDWYEQAGNVGSTAPIQMYPEDQWYGATTVDDTYTADIKVAAYGFYAIPGYQTNRIKRGVTPYVIRQLDRNDGENRIGRKNYACEKWCRIDPIAHIEGGFPALGPNGETVPAGGSSNGVFIAEATPRLWSRETLPSHPDHVRDHVFACAGARPSDPPSGWRARCIAYASRQQALALSARVPFVRTFSNDNPSNAPELRALNGAAPETTARLDMTTLAWDEPVDPFVLAPNGRYNIENTLDDQAAAVGGVRDGSTDRHMVTHEGGKLHISRTGLVTWTAAQTAHAPLSLSLTHTDGLTTKVSLRTHAARR